MWSAIIEVPHPLRPFVAYVTGTDLPEGDAQGCFRLADACVLAAHRLAGTDGADRAASRMVGERWDGAAQQAFARRVRVKVGGRRSELVTALIDTAVRLNGTGLAIQYAERMITLVVVLVVVTVPVLIAQGGWLLRPFLRLARMSVVQIRNTTLALMALFGGLGAGLDLLVQATQLAGGRRDGIDLRQAGTALRDGAIEGLLTGLLTGGLGRLATPAVRAGVARAEAGVRDRLLAYVLTTVPGQALQYGLAGGGATALGLWLDGQPLHLRTVLLGATSAAVGADGQHAATLNLARQANGTPPPDLTTPHSTTPEPTTPHPTTPEPTGPELGRPGPAPDAAPRTALAQAAGPERVHPVPDGSQAAPHDRPSGTPAAHGPIHGRVPVEGGVPGPRDHPAPERVADQGPVSRARPGRLVDLVNRQVPDAPAPVAGSARGDVGFAAPVGDGPFPRTADVRWQDLADDPRYAYPVKRLEEFDPSGAARLRDQVESGTLADRTQFAAALDTALVNRPPLASPHVLRVGERQFTGGFFPGEPLYLSKGGESLVYAYDAGVVKVNYSATGRAVGWASDGWAPERVVAAEATGALEKVAGNRIRRGAVLVTFHGPSQVLAEHVHVLERRWPGRIVNEFVQGGPALDAERGYVLPTLVSTQRRISGFDGLDNPDLSTGYAEMAENPDTDAHVAANRKWLQLAGPPGFDHELFVTMQRNDSVSRLLVRTAEDPALRAAVRAFAGNAIAYTRATGEIMDLIGNGNVIFPASGSYLLVDALSPSPLPTSAASEALQRLDAREPLTAKDRAILLNVLNYVRTVNALADATGLAERIGIVPPGFDPRSWERLLPALR